MSDELRKVIKEAGGDQSLSVSFEAVWSRSRQLRRARAVLVLFAGVAVGAAVFQLANLASTTNGDDSRPIGPATAEPTEFKPPVEGEVFVPASHERRGQRVMPVTLPDGSRLTLTIDEDLDLTDFGARPITYGEIVEADPRCGRDISAGKTIRDFSPAKEPIAQYEGGSAAEVGLWPASDGDLVQNYLVFRFDTWYLGIPDGAGCSLSEDLIAQWIEGVSAEMDEEGFLLINGSPPVALTSTGGQGPQLLFSSQDGEQFFRIFHQECSGFETSTSVEGQPANIGDGFGTWCVGPANIGVSANGDEKFVRELIRGMDIQNEDAS